ncbi:MAG: hypothetical protein LBB41_05560 [Prevotellaceae bacterium]|jgi:hypothetical protein|nr:hypothetical protein [Prevotellaceae bacterium]
MSEIKNIEGMTVDDLNRELAAGGKFVVFEYCISIIVMTFKRGSDIYFIKRGQSTVKYSIGFTLLTLLLGWWGIPFGPIYSIWALVINFKGGKNVTQDVINSFNNAN